MKKYTALALSLVLCLFLTACSGPETFEGYYEFRNDEHVSSVEFFKDGTAEVYQDGLFIEGTYKKTGNNEYELRITLLFVQQRYKIERTHDSVTVINPEKDTAVVYDLVK